MKGKRITLTVFLLILMLSTATENYIKTNLDADNLLNIFAFGLISFLISSTCMMFFPLILRLINQEKLETKSGRKICRWNSIILLIISIFLNVGLIGGVGAVAFYFINKWAFVKDPEPQESTEKDSPDNENNGE